MTKLPEGARFITCIRDDESRAQCEDCIAPPVFNEAMRCKLSLAPLRARSPACMLHGLAPVLYRVLHKILLALLEDEISIKITLAKCLLDIGDLLPVNGHATLLNVTSCIAA